MITEESLDGRGRAVFSDDRRYRYVLERGDEPSRLLIIMLNPSTADALADDPTIAKLVRLTARWGAPGFTVVNLFAYRTPHPRDLRSLKDPVGEANEATVHALMLCADTIVAAWGAVGDWAQPCINRVLAIADTHALDLYCVGVTKDGQPKHPLARGRSHVPENVELELWRRHGLA